MNHPASQTLRYAVIVSIALGIVVSSARPSAAATLTTPPVYLPNDTALMVCVLTNIGSKPLDFNIQAFNQAGTLVGGSSGTIQPGATGGGGGGGTDWVGWDYCRADGVSKSKAILEACVQTSFGSLCQQTSVNR